MGVSLQQIAGLLSLFDLYNTLLLYLISFSGCPRETGREILLPADERAVEVQVG